MFGQFNKLIHLFQTVPQSIDKHRQLMASVLADQRLTELQQRGGAWLAGLTSCSSGLAQKSPDCRYQRPKFRWCALLPLVHHVCQLLSKVIYRKR